MAAELVRPNVDVIVASGSGAVAAKKATNTIPIVITYSGDPVGSGLVASLAHPGGNATGMSSFVSELGGKQLELLKEAYPRVSHVAVLAKQHNANTLYLLQTVPGIGKILSLVLRYEIHDIRHFPSVQDFVSYGRLVTCAKEAAGKRDGTAGTKIGHAYHKWAFSEAAVLFLRDHSAGQTSLTRLAKKHG